MKVHFHYGIKTYSGKLDDIVFTMHNNKEICIARRYVIPKPGPAQSNFKTVATNLKTLWLAVKAGYKSDLALYAVQFNNMRPDNCNVGTYSLFVKILYAAQKEAEFDLRTCTYTDISASTSAVSTVKKAIEAGYLPSVKITTALTQAM